MRTAMRPRYYCDHCNKGNGSPSAMRRHERGCTLNPQRVCGMCEFWNGGPLTGWGKVRHGWGRTVPDSTGEYTFLMLPAKPHARGAYPTTTIVDDPAYDHE